MKSGTHENGQSEIDIDPELTQSVEDMDSVSRAVIETVSAVKGIDPLELPPLEHYLNTQALDTFWNTSADEDHRSTLRVSFTYADYQVTVIDNETITLHPKREIAADD
jgi:hypothetical protein